MRKLVSALVVPLMAFALTACGRIGPPLPPEAFAPSSPRDVEVFAGAQGVRFRWASPVTDVRGEELESLSGYSLHRVAVVQPGDRLIPSDRNKIAQIEDRSTDEWLERLEEARAQKIPSRRIQRDASLTEFEYTDETAEFGQTYLYQLVPLSKREVFGRPSPYFRIRFSGLTSAVESFQSEDDLTLEFGAEGT